MFVVPGCQYSAGSGFEGHEYFEAASIRKVNGKYVFIYSSIWMHELCWAISDDPMSGFKYGGVLVSNCDIGVANGKPAAQNMGYGANNHGSMVQIGDDWYIFYHRHTNGNWYCRQGCAEKLTVTADTKIPQVEMTSCGLNGGPLRGTGTYPAYIACNMFDADNLHTDGHPVFTDLSHTRVTQDGADGDHVLPYVCYWHNASTLGYKYFDCKDLKKIRVTMRGYADGYVEVRTSWNGEMAGRIKIHTDNRWKDFTDEVKVPDGVQALYFTYRGTGNPALREFELI